MCIRKTGCRSGNFLWLLLCASIFRTVCTLLGTQCKGVRIWISTTFAGKFNCFTNTNTSPFRYEKLVLGFFFSFLIRYSIFKQPLFFHSKQQLLLIEEQGLADSANHPSTHLLKILKKRREGWWKTLWQGCAFWRTVYRITD